jgi:pimeloyl-ACP methyl ester carboxylesterase
MAQTAGGDPVYRAALAGAAGLMERGEANGMPAAGVAAVARRVWRRRLLAGWNGGSMLGAVAGAGRDAGGRPSRAARPSPSAALWMKAQFDATTRFDCTGRLSQIRVPVLIVHGRSDRIAPVALAEQMHSLIPGSRLVLIDGGHLAPLLTQWYLTRS